MSDSFKPWRKVRRNGHYFRKLLKTRQGIENELHVNMNEISQNDGIGIGISAPRSDLRDAPSSPISELNIVTSFSEQPVESEAEPNDEVVRNIGNELVENEEESCEHRMHKFLQRWAVQYNVPAQTLAPLFEQLNDVYRCRLPKDPRTLLGTRQKEPQPLIEMSGGYDWHQGFETCVRHRFSRMQTPMAISININIDGIPIYKNGNSQFWPILFNVQEFPAMKPMDFQNPKKSKIFCSHLSMK